MRAGREKVAGDGGSLNTVNYGAVQLRKSCNPPHTSPPRTTRGHVITRAANDPSVFTITEKAPTRAFSCLKVDIFTFKTLLRHYAKAKLVPKHSL